VFIQFVYHLVRLVPMKPTEPVVKSLDVKTPKAIVEADHSLRVAHPVSQLVIAVEASDSVQLCAFSIPVPLGLPVVAPVPVTILR